jgi:hypothetical protein
MIKVYYMHVWKYHNETPTLYNSYVLIKMWLKRVNLSVKKINRKKSPSKNSLKKKKTKT